MATEVLTIDDLILAGYTLEEAQTIVGDSSTGGIGLPIAKFTYSEALADNGIPKGSFTSGFKDDKVNITEEGIVYGSEGVFFVVDCVHQITSFDENQGKVVFKTPIYRDVYSSNKQVCSITGLTAAQYKSDTDRKVTYSDIYLLMLKTPSMTDFAPVVVYFKGVAKMHLQESFKKFKVENKFKISSLFTFKNIKVATKYNPAWVMDILSVTPRSHAEVGATVGITREPMRKFREWADTSATKTYHSYKKEVEDDEDIPF